MSSDRYYLKWWKFLHCLNPFGTGQCLPTERITADLYREIGLNPFGTGQCLPTNFGNCITIKSKSQSLWNRAVSSDEYFNFAFEALDLSQSLWNRAVSSDCSGILKPCGTRLTRATSQLFPRLRELGLDLIKCCTSFNILFTYQAVENGRDFTRVFRFY